MTSSLTTASPLHPEDGHWVSPCWSSKNSNPVSPGVQAWVPLWPQCMWGQTWPGVESRSRGGRGPGGTWSGLPGSSGQLLHSRGGTEPPSCEGLGRLQSSSDQSAEGDRVESRADPGPGPIAQLTLCTGLPHPHSSPAGQLSVLTPSRQPAVICPRGDRPQTGCGLEQGWRT